MKIIILVLILSLSYKFKCEKSKSPLEAHDDGEEFKENETEKIDVVLKEDEAEMVDVALKEDETEKVDTPLKEDEAEKVDVELKEDEAEMVDAPKEDEAEMVDAPKEDEAEMVDTAVKEEETEKKIPEDDAEKLNTAELQENEKDKNDEKVDECAICDDEKKLASNEEPDKINENEKEKKLKGVVNEFSGGNPADLFGINQHYNIPANFADFGRRFVLQYPYTETKNIDEDAEQDLHNTIKQYIQNKQDLEGPLPVKAPPKFVLAIAKKSAILESSKPKNPTDDIIQKDILRTGNYWDDVWKEEIDPKKILRTSHSKNNLESVTVEIKSGSKLYDLISMLKEKSPRLLYVINNKDFE